MPKTFLCIGGLLLDELHVCRESIIQGTSNPTIIKRSVGGVMGNVSRQLGLLGIPVELISAVGFDGEATLLLETLDACSVQYPRMLRTTKGSGKFTAFLEPEGNLFAATCSDQANLEITPEYLHQLKLDPECYSMVVIDNNLPTASIQWLIDFSTHNQLPIIIEPVSIPKIQKWDKLNMQGVFMITPNEAEWAAFMDSTRDHQDQLTELNRRGIKRAWVRRGDQASLWFEGREILEQHVQPVAVFDSTGAGDASLAGWIAGWHWGWDDAKCRQAAQVMASAVLSVEGSVHPCLSEQNFKNWMMP
jgi:pseudouridine kinase